MVLLNRLAPLGPAGEALFSAINTLKEDRGEPDGKSTAPGGDDRCTAPGCRAAHGPGCTPAHTTPKRYEASDQAGGLRIVVFPEVRLREKSPVSQVLLSHHQ
jgi:hypothetical protein